LFQLDGDGFREQDVWGVAEIPWFVQPGTEEDEGRPHGGYSSSQGAQRAVLSSALW